MSDARGLLIITETDAHSFLQGLVTNNVDGIADGLVYAALLTPQGKFMADFFLSKYEGGILLDASADQLDMLKMRLTMYKLRADVQIAAKDLFVHRGLGDVPVDGFADPRSDTLGWRAYRDTPQDQDDTDWTALRVDALVPERGPELDDNSFILEMGFERLNGVDFRKGCYVGQEVTARMKHKTELRKGLVKVTVNGAAEPGTPITSNGKAAGTLHSRSGDQAMAYLRFMKAKGELKAGEATIIWDGAKS